MDKARGHIDKADSHIYKAGGRRLGWCLPPDYSETGVSRSVLSEGQLDVCGLTVFGHSDDHDALLAVHVECSGVAASGRSELHAVYAIYDKTGFLCP